MAVRKAARKDQSQATAKQTATSATHPISVVGVVLIVLGLVALVY